MLPSPFLSVYFRELQEDWWNNGDLIITFVGIDESLVTIEDITYSYNDEFSFHVDTTSSSAAEVGTFDVTVSWYYEEKSQAILNLPFSFEVITPCL